MDIGLKKRFMELWDRYFPGANTLTFAAPFEKFARMGGNMKASFLITNHGAKSKRESRRELD